MVRTLSNRFGRLPNLLINDLALTAELDHWKNRCLRTDKAELESDAIEALKSCEGDIYPTISKLLQILCTLPVTNASAERSFSTLKLQKT